MNLIYSPQVVFSRAEFPRNWPRYFLIVAAGCVGAGLAMYPFSLQATASAIARIVTTDEAREALQQIESWMLVGIALSPLVVLFKTCLYATLLWLVVHILGREAPFRHLFAIVMASSIALMLELWYIVLILVLQGLETVASPLDLQVPIGLDLLISGEASQLAGIVAQINPFEIWFVLLLVFGLTKGQVLKSRQAWAVSVSLWTASAVVLERLHALSRNYSTFLN